MNINQAVDKLVSYIPHLVNGAVESGLSMESIVAGLSRIVSGTDNLGVGFDTGIAKDADYYHNVAEAFFYFLRFLEGDDDGLDVVEEFVALINNA